MVNKFQGPDGKRRLAETLMDHTFIKGNSEVATLISEKGQLIEVMIGEAFIEQGNDDNDLYIIICGTAEVLVNGRIVAQREAGKHVGEMALIDHAAKRSATVRAMDIMTLLKLSEPDFSEIANSFPFLWRNIATELAGRLRQRGTRLKAPNETPLLFIGSSSEMLKHANSIQAGLAYDKVIPTVWTNGVFGVSKTPIESLVEQVEKSDFAVLVLAAEDIVSVRGEESSAPRDNVIFELGLFIGKLGRERVYVVAEHGLKVKVPTDLLGVSFIEYVNKPGNTNLDVIMGPVCHEIRNKILELGSL